ncbi:MAG TPA: zf-HC2 domain-containing protein [Dehalococcoidia bacterium]|nr:zf-HC2 domain-containing protein [Dehalococcoidia bacterium]
MLWRNPHRRFQERLSAYLDGELSPDGARALQAHLDSCDTCAAEFADLRMASSALAELPEVEVPRSFALTPDLVGRAAPQAYGARSASTGFRLAGGALAAALAVVLVLDAGGIVDNGGEHAGGGDEFRQGASNYDATSNAATSPPVGDASIAEQGGAATGEDPEASPGIGADGEERSFQAPTPTPAATEIPGDAAAGLGLNGSGNDDNKTLATGDLNDDSGDGLSALTVTEIVLAALLGASIIGIVAATYAGRRRG